MMIAPGEHRIIAVNGTSPYGVLNNGAETITLKPNGPSKRCRGRPPSKDLHLRPLPIPTACALRLPVARSNESDEH